MPRHIPVWPESAFPENRIRRMLALAEEAMEENRRWKAIVRFMVNMGNLGLPIPPEMLAGWKDVD